MFPNPFDSFVKPSISRQSVELKKPDFDLKRGLLKSLILPWVPVSINSAVARETVRKEAPIDGREVVNWMHYAAADIAVFDGATEEYNRLGSELLSTSGDPYIPGVRVGNLSGVSVKGFNVRNQGYGEVETPDGSFRVPNGGKAIFARGNTLAWGAIPQCWDVQWILTLLHWRDLAKAPISQRVRFPSSYGLVAPNFFSISTRIPAPMATLRVGLTSDKPQTMTLRGRGVKGAFQDVLLEDSVNVEAGESEVVYNVFGFPLTPAFTLELQPQDGTSTILDYLEAFP